VASGDFQRALDLLRAGVTALLATDPSGLDEAALVAAVTGFERERRRLEAVDQRLLAKLAESRLPATVLGHALQVDGREASARISRAHGLGPRRTLSGEPLAPALPTLSAAVVDGAVSPAQADVILDAVERLPDSAPPGAQSVVEAVLVEAARCESPRLLRRTAAALLDRLDPDGPEPRDDRKQRGRGFGLAVAPDGWSRPSGRFSPELTAYLQALLDSLAAPQKQDGEPDQRTATQRRHDALLDALTRVLRSGTLPECGGVPVTVLATVQLPQLAEAVGYPGLRAAAEPSVEPAPSAATPDLGLAELAAEAGLDLAELLAAPSSGLAVLGHGQVVPIADLLRMAGEAEIVPVVLCDGGGVLAYGRERRLATKGQRLALAARDGGCSFPGCDRPAAWCEVHHVRAWVNDGHTDIDNLVLLCPHHHRWFEGAGWVVRLRGGVPEWLPPTWLDPERTPRRNTAHHLKEIVFRQPSAA